MTKEEILDNALPDVIEYPHYNLDNFQRSVALDAMDEYAKVQAIEFDKWKRGLFLIREQKTERWLINFSMNEWSLFSENDEQLYNLFLEHQLNNGGK